MSEKCTAYVRRKAQAHSCEAGATTSIKKGTIPECAGRNNAYVALHTAEKVHPRDCKKADYALGSK